MQTTTLPAVDVDLDEISLQIYAYPRYKRGLNEDDCGDFYVYYYPKLLSILTRFEDRGTPFAHYLNKSLKWELKGYLRQKRKNRYSLNRPLLKDLWEETTRFLPGPEEQTLTEPDPPLLFALDANGKIKSAAERKQALFHSLTHSLRLTEEHITKLAVLTGMDRIWLQGVVNILNENLKRYQCRQTYLTSRINRLFFGIRSTEQMLQYGYPEDLRESMEKKAGKMRSILANAIQNLLRVRMTSSFEKIAEATGFPKGTVSSAVAAMKKKLTWIHKQKESWYTPGPWK